MTTIYPQLAKQAEITSLAQYITNDSWVMEQKLDGHRVLLVSQPDGSAVGMTRNGSHYTRALPKEITAFRFPAGQWIVDGELVGNTFYAFDLPLSPLANTTGRPLWQRRALLETMLNSIRHPFKLVPQARTRDEKVELADRALKRNFEGLVLKRREAPYRSAGRTEEWLKVKFVVTCDVIVTDVRADGKDSVGYAVIDNGVLRDLGRASLIGKEKAGQIDVGDVLEVRYLYVGANGRLYQPTIMRKRIDKRPDECTADQLKYVNKEVLEAL